MHKAHIADPSDLSKNDRIQLLVSMGDHVNDIVVTPGRCDVVNAQAQGMGQKPLIVQGLNNLSTRSSFCLRGHRIFQIEKYLIH